MGVSLCMQLFIKPSNYKTFLQIHLRSVSYFITCPVFYANAKPHIGHVYTLVLADAINRYQRIKLCTNDTLLSTGLDEHGTKVQKAANSKGLSTIVYCKLMADDFRKTFEAYDTTLNDFIRTSEDRNRDKVKVFWRKISDSIYRGKFSGWYSVSDEAYVPQSQVSVIEHEGKEIHVDKNGNELVWTDETNYMFKFEKYKQDVLDWLKTKPIIPQNFNDEAIKMAQELGDLSISRPSEKVYWAFPVLHDSTQSVYVWFDALTSYLTVAGQKRALKRWPPDCQVFGKDILKFHAVYWPAFLIAAGYELPKKLVCHSHWLVDSHKMSKSRGNVVDPNIEQEKLTGEGLRYYLLRTGTCHSDTNYSHEAAINCINAELANKYGNLLSRCLSKSLNPNQAIPTKLVNSKRPEISEILGHLETLPKICQDNYEDADFYRGIDAIMKVLDKTNSFFSDNEPWKLAKSSNSESLDLYSDIITMSFESLRICSILMQPIVPKIATHALDKMNVVNRNLIDTRISIREGDPKVNHRFINCDLDSIIFNRLKE